MSLTLPIESMTVEEKVQAMELLWDSLCAKAESVIAPAWHGEVLAQREQAVRDGSDRFEDWEQAKKNIRSLIP